MVVTNASNVTIRNSTIGPCGDEAVYLSEADGAVLSGNFLAGTGNGVLSIARIPFGSIRMYLWMLAGTSCSSTMSTSGFIDSGNRGQNELGGSIAEDSSPYGNRTARHLPSWCRNSLRGAGPSNIGSGIMLGDGGGSYQVAHDNNLVDPGQVGIGVASWDQYHGDPESHLFEVDALV